MSSLFKHAPENERREELVEATLECISELGIQATSVRAVAARAGVSHGLIRHHFDSKANLIVEAYRKTLELITASSMEVLESREGRPHDRFRRFVRATLAGQASEYRMLSLWATFVSQRRVDPMIAAVRDEGYMNLRRATEPLVAQVFTAEARPLVPEEIERMTIIVHTVLHGLWIEACLNEEPGVVEKLIELGLDSIEKLLDVRLGRGADYSECLGEHARH